MPDYASGGVFSCEIVDDRPGLTTLEILGPAAQGIFSQESGGHRFQRVPPTERNGRVQTSTITVAVLPDIAETEILLPERDLEWTMTISRGKGGQSVNTTYSCVVLKHKPSGIMVRCQNERSQHRNKRTALAILSAKLAARADCASSQSRSQDRKAQLGIGARGDKRRTIRVRDNQVKDHLTGRAWRWDDYERGKW